MEGFRTSTGRQRTNCNGRLPQIQYGAAAPPSTSGSPHFLCSGRLENRPSDSVSVVLSPCLSIGPGSCLPPPVSRQFAVAFSRPRKGIHEAATATAAASTSSATFRSAAANATAATAVANQASTQRKSTQGNATTHRSQQPPASQAFRCHPRSHFHSLNSQPHGGKPKPTPNDMAPPQLAATFVPGGFDDYYMPEVVAPSPQRVTPQVPQNMQEDLQRMELEAISVEPRSEAEPATRHTREPSLSTYTHPSISRAAEPPATQATKVSDDDIRAYQSSDDRAERLNTMSWDAPSFSPFPKVKGDNIPPTDEEKEEILWNARKHVLHSQNVSMQITWARDVLTWAEIAQDAVARENVDRQRPATPRIEHELRLDAINIITYLSQQEHPEALYMRSKWLEFGKFGNRVDKREAYGGYKRAADLGHGRSEYRMGMLYEQSNDMSKAKEHYYRGLSLRDSASLYRMGMMSLLGQHGESKDYNTGLDRIEAAADSSDEDAPQGAYVYGMLIGRDLPDINIPEGLLSANVQNAKVYIEKASYLGFAKAQLKMGQAFELCQLGCEFNPSYSLHYYGLAARQGLPEAALGVSRWFLFGYEGVFKKNESLAYRYAQEAAAAKLPTGEFALGYYNEIGVHVEKSINEARKWYQLAADHGNKDALGRLDSLSQDKTLSKADHETTTLTRIKSQHGSQRGARPDRFKQPSQMPTLSESGPGSPVNEEPPPPKPKSTSPGPVLIRMRLWGFSRLLFRPNTSTFRIRPEPHLSFQPLRTGLQHLTLLLLIPSTTDHHRWPSAPSPQHRTPTTICAALVIIPPGTRPGPQADRPASAFGIKPQASGPRPMPQSQSMGNLQPTGPGGRPDPRADPRGDPRGRVQSAGWDPQVPGAYRQIPPGPQSPPGRPYPEQGGRGRPGSAGRGRPGSAQPYPGQGGPPGQGPPGQRLQKQQPMPGQFPPAGAYPSQPPRTSSRTGPPPEPLPPLNNSQATSQNYERFSRVPGAAGRPERMSSLPPGQMPQQQQKPQPQPPAKQQHDLRPQPPQLDPRQSSSQADPRQSRAASAQPGRPPIASPGGPGRVESAPPSQFQRPESKPSPAPSAATMPTKPGKGPATFEDMGIPQGKQDGDCVVM
ncbi:hypothetical protein G7046_g2014 [Stylonectria norvegica]|nr:hypothetical protein G7046_g2014 [Stylonectria norvegica]